MPKAGYTTVSLFGCNFQSKTGENKMVKNKQRASLYTNKSLYIITMYVNPPVGEETLFDER